MRLFDEVKCKLPLPWDESAEFLWQSKETPEQYLALYEIRENGQLWRRIVDKEYPMTFGLPEPIKVTTRWERELDFNGQIEIHHMEEIENTFDRWWYSVTFWFRDGVVKDFFHSKLLHKYET